MPLETGTYIADLVSSNPPTGDLETQGANHLQLIKSVLQNTFGTIVRRFVGLPTTLSLSASATLAAATSTNTTHLINTASGAVTLTLPNTLAAADAGWECSFIKTTSDTNPVFLVPPSGTIQSGEYTGLTKVRRCVPGRRTRVIWTGSAFVAERVESRPIGTVFDSMFSNLPVGYEWANGQTLSSAANYPEFFALNGNAGTTPDARNRASFGLDNPGGTGSSNRITVAGGNFDGTVINGNGGAQNHTLSLAEAPTGQFTHTFTDPGHTHPTTPGSPNVGQTGAGAGFTTSNAGPFASGTGLSINSANTNITSTITDHAGGGSHTILPPAIIFAKILVVE